ncbi:MAG TPA: hypothetical protein QF753_05925 [Victivallales bacterium]|nr:hypothetical protein [Victivallales bacterium]
MKYLKKFIKIFIETKKYKPWMTDAEIAVIKQILINSKPKKILEWGAGSSTIFFSNLLPKKISWTSIEHNKKYSEMVKTTLKKKLILNWYKNNTLYKTQFFPLFLKKICNFNKNNQRRQITIHHIAPNHLPFSDKYEDGAYSDMKDYIDFPKNKNEYDLIFIDGRARSQCLRHALSLIKVDGIVILHDAHREYYHDASKLYPYQMYLLDQSVKDLEPPYVGRGLWFGCKTDIINKILNIKNHTIFETNTGFDYKNLSKLED